MKINFKKMKTLSCGLLLLAMGTTSTGVSAASPDFTYSSIEDDFSWNTHGNIVVSTNLWVDTPLITSCSVKSKGISNHYFDKRKTNITEKLLKHTITVSTDGIGHVSFSTSGIGAESASKENVFETKDALCSYTIYTDMWRLLSYKEKHLVQYQLSKKIKGQKKPVTMSVIVSTKVGY